MRWLVAGGTGYLGSALVGDALRAGHLVSVLARSAAAADRARALGAVPFAGDLARPEGLRDVGRDHDVIVHSAGIVVPDRAAVDRAATEALIESARRAGAPRLFVYTSGTWWLGAYAGRPDGEDATPRPVPFASYRAALERDVIAAAAP